jgi:hypothetical protein
LRGCSLAAALRRLGATSLVFGLAAFGLACESESSFGGVETPSLRILDSTELEGEFSGIVGAARTSGGAIVIGDRGQSALHVLRLSNGSTLQLGRAGDGPGEFRLLYRVHRCAGDTLIAYDFAHSRLQLFTEAGFSRQVQLPGRLVGSDFVGCTGYDTLVFSRLPDQVPGLGLQLEPITLFQYSLSKGTSDWLVTLRGTEMFVSERYKAFYERPFGTQTLIAAGPRGVGFAENGRLEVQQVLADGKPRSIFFRAVKRAEVTREDRAAYLRERLAEEPDSAARVRLRGVLSEAEWGARFPAVDRLIASRSGQFWLRHPPAANRTDAQWTVVEPGSPASGVETVLLPRNMRLLFVDGYDVIGVVENSTGDEKLLVLKLEKRGGS